MKKEMIIFGLCIFLMSVVVAEEIDVDQIDLSRQLRLQYGKVLYLRQIETTPEKIAPGQEAVINLVLKNIGEFYLRDIEVSLNLPSSFSPSSENVLRKKIRALDAEEEMEIEFKVVASPDATAGLYSSTINLEYLNKVGTEVSESIDLGLVVIGDPEFLVEFTETDILKETKKGEVTLTISNKGVGDVKFLTTSFQESDKYKIIKGKEQYMGNIDSDDFEEVTLDLRLNEEYDEIIIPVILEYKDSFNEPHEETFEVTVNFQSQKDLAGGTNWILIVVVLAVIGYIIYRFWKKRKSKK